MHKYPHLILVALILNELIASLHLQNISNHNFSSQPQREGGLRPVTTVLTMLSKPSTVFFKVFIANNQMLWNW